MGNVFDMNTRPPEFCRECGRPLKAYPRRPDGRCHECGRAIDSEYEYRIHIYKAGLDKDGKE